MIGGMDQRITLQRLVETPDGVGGVVRTWANVASAPSVWAKVIAKAGREATDGGRMNSSFVVLFTIYNRDDLTDRDQILWDGVGYNIRSIRKESGRHLFLVIEAERGVAP